MRRSVFLTALGADAQKLSPQVREYVSGPPEGIDFGEGHGVFDVAGSPLGRLMLLLRPVVGPGLLVTRWEREVPFEIVNRPRRTTLAATRTFAFRSGRQRFVDLLRPGAIPGTVVDVLGERGRIEVLLDCSVTPEGDLRLRSRACRLCFGRVVVRLPALLGVDIDVVDGYDSERDRRTIVAEVRNPIVGIVMAYRGWFRYEYRSDEW